MGSSVDKVIPVSGLRVGGALLKFFSGRRAKVGQRQQRPFLRIVGTGQMQGRSLVCQLDGGNQSLRPGMTGYARIHTGRRSLSMIAVDRVLRAPCLGSIKVEKRFGGGRVTFHRPACLLCEAIHPGETLL